jgi:hypothetical protein
LPVYAVKKALDSGIPDGGKVRCFHERPSQVPVAILAIALAFLFAITQFF